MERRRRWGIVCAVTLSANARAFVKRFGIEKCGFVTFTFAENLQFTRAADRRTAGKRWHNITRRLLPAIGAGEWVRVVEPQRSGRIHFHVLCSFPWDIRSGVDVQAFSRRDYRTAGPELRRIWRELRERAPGYGFGRCEIMPVRDGGAIGEYVGKYIGKGLIAEDHAGWPGRMRRVMYSGAWRAATQHWRWSSGESAAWRRDVAQAASVSGLGEADVRRIIGKAWAFEVTKARRVGRLSALFGACSDISEREARTAVRVRAGKRLRLRQGEFWKGGAG